jgi:hypothetical protein
MYASAHVFATLTFLCLFSILPLLFLQVSDILLVHSFFRFLPSATSRALSGLCRRRSFVGPRAIHWWSFTLPRDIPGWSFTFPSCIFSFRPIRRKLLWRSVRQKIARGSENEREQARERVCVCVRERVRKRERASERERNERERIRARESERESARERGNVCVCICLTAH